MKATEEALPYRVYVLRSWQEPKERCRNKLQKTATSVRWRPSMPLQTLFTLMVPGAATKRGSITHSLLFGSRLGLRAAAQSGVYE